MAYLTHSYIRDNESASSSTQSQQRWQARDKRSLNLYEKLAEQKQKEQNEELDDSLSCAVLQACSGPSTCTIIDRGNGYKQKMVIIKWMFFFFLKELTIGSAVMLEHKTEYKDYLRCRPLSQRRSLAFPGVNCAILAVPCPSLYFRKEQ